MTVNMIVKPGDEFLLPFLDNMKWHAKNSGSEEMCVFLETGELVAHKYGSGDRVCTAVGSKFPWYTKICGIMDAGQRMAGHSQTMIRKPSFEWFNCKRVGHFIHVHSHPGSGAASYADFKVLMLDYISRFYIVTSDGDVYWYEPGVGGWPGIEELETFSEVVNNIGKAW